MHENNFGVGDEDDLAFEFAFVLGEVLLRVDRGEDSLCSDGTVGAGGPGERESDERCVVGLDESAVEFFVLPGVAEGPPRFEMDVLQTVGLEALDDPFGCGAMGELVMRGP
jgi:hypothetical protein